MTSTQRGLAPPARNKQLQSNQRHKHSDLHNGPPACERAVIKSCQALVSSLRGERVRVHRAVQESCLGCTTDHVPPGAQCHWGVSPSHGLLGVLHQAAWLCHQGDTARAQACTSSVGKMGANGTAQEKVSQVSPKGGTPGTGDQMQEPASHSHMTKKTRVSGSIHSWLICVTSRILLQLPNATTSQVIYIFMEYLPQTS